MSKECGAEEHHRCAMTFCVCSCHHIVILRTVCAWCHGPSNDPTISHGICWRHSQIWLLKLRWSIVKRRWAAFREWMLIDLVKERAAIPEPLGIAFGIVVSVLAWATMIGAAYGLGWLAPLSWLWGLSQ